MPTITHRSRDVNFCEKYDGIAWRYDDVGEEGTNGRQNQNNKCRRHHVHYEDALGEAKKPVLSYDR